MASKSAARRTVKEGGAYVNNAKVTGEDAVPAKEDLLHGRWLVLRRGKKNLAAVEITGAERTHPQGACSGAGDRLPAHAPSPYGVGPGLAQARSRRRLPRTDA